MAPLSHTVLATHRLREPHHTTDSVAPAVLRKVAPSASNTPPPDSSAVETSESALPLDRSGSRRGFNPAAYAVNEEFQRRTTMVRARTCSYPEHWASEASYAAGYGDQAAQLVRDHVLCVRCGPADIDAAAASRVGPRTFVVAEKAALLHVWRSRREARRFHEALRRVAQAKFEHMIPSPVHVPLAALVAHQGAFVSVAWLPPLYSDGAQTVDRSAACWLVIDTLRAALHLRRSHAVALHLGADSRMYALLPPSALLYHQFDSVAAALAGGGAVPFQHAHIPAALLDARPDLLPVLGNAHVPDRWRIEAIQRAAAALVDHFAVPDDRRIVALRQMSTSIGRAYADGIVRTVLKEHGVATRQLGAVIVELRTAHRFRGRDPMPFVDAAVSVIKADVVARSLAHLACKAMQTSFETSTDDALLACAAAEDQASQQLISFFRTAAFFADTVIPTVRQKYFESDTDLATADLKREDVKLCLVPMLRFVAKRVGLHLAPDNKSFDGAATAAVAVTRAERAPLGTAHRKPDVAALLQLSLGSKVPRGVRVRHLLRALHASMYHPSAASAAFDDADQAAIRDAYPTVSRSIEAMSDAGQSREESADPAQVLAVKHLLLDACPGDTLSKTLAGLLRAHVPRGRGGGVSPGSRTRSPDDRSPADRSPIDNGSFIAVPARAGNSAPPTPTPAAATPPLQLSGSPNGGPAPDASIEGGPTGVSGGGTESPPPAAAVPELPSLALGDLPIAVSEASPKAAAASDDPADVFRRLAERSRSPLLDALFFGGRMLAAVEGTTTIHFSSAASATTAAPTASATLSAANATPAAPSSLPAPAAVDRQRALTAAAAVALRAGMRLWRRACVLAAYRAPPAALFDALDAVAAAEEFVAAAAAATASGGEAAFASLSGELLRAVCALFPGMGAYASGSDAETWRSKLLAVYAHAITSQASRLVSLCGQPVPLGAVAGRSRSPMSRTPCPTPKHRADLHPQPGLNGSRTPEPGGSGGSMSLWQSGGTARLARGGHAPLLTVGVALEPVVAAMLAGQQASALDALQFRLQLAVCSAAAAGDALPAVVACRASTLCGDAAGTNGSQHLGPKELSLETLLTPKHLRRSRAAAKAAAAGDSGDSIAAVRRALSGGVAKMIDFASRRRLPTAADDWAQTGLVLRALMNLPEHFDTAHETYRAVRSYLVNATSPSDADAAMAQPNALLANVRRAVKALRTARDKTAAEQWARTMLWHTEDIGCRTLLRRAEAVHRDMIVDAYAEPLRDGVCEREAIARAALCRDEAAAARAALEDAAMLPRLLAAADDEPRERAALRDAYRESWYRASLLTIVGHGGDALLQGDTAFRHAAARAEAADRALIVLEREEAEARAAVETSVFTPTHVLTVMPRWSILTAEMLLADFHGRFATHVLPMADAVFRRCLGAEEARRRQTIVQLRALEPPPAARSKRPTESASTAPAEAVSTGSAVAKDVPLTSVASSPRGDDDASWIDSGSPPSKLGSAQALPVATAAAAPHAGQQTAAPTAGKPAEQNSPGSPAKTSRTATSLLSDDDKSPKHGRRAPAGAAAPIATKPKPVAPTRRRR